MECTGAKPTRFVFFIYFFFFVVFFFCFAVYAQLKTQGKCNINN